MNSADAGDSSPTQRIGLLHHFVLMTHFPHPEYDESTASSEDERPVLDCRFGP